MEKDRGALLIISDKRPNLRAKEADLQKLRQPAVVVTGEDADSEVEEVIPQEKARIQNNHDPCATAP
jgi:riboflavin biosynthesis pyrimidine reductase